MVRLFTMEKILNIIALEGIMKKLTKFCCLFALVSLVFVSCGKEDPDTRFKKALTKSVADAMTENTKSANAMNADLKKGANATFALELGEGFDVYKEMISESLGFSFDWLNQVQLSFDYGNKDSGIFAVLGLGVNKKGLLDLNVLSSGDKTYFQIPGIVRDAYFLDGDLYSLLDQLEYGLGDIYRNIYEGNEKYPTAEEFEKFVNGFIQALVNPISGVVETNESVSLSFNDITVEDTPSKLSVTIDEALANKISASVSEFLENDTFLEDFLKLMDTTNSYSMRSFNGEIVDTISEGLVEFAAVNPVVSLYLGKKDAIQGFEIAVPDEGTISSLFLEKGSNFVYELAAKEDDSTLVSVKGSGKINAGKFNGDFTLNIPEDYSNDYNFDFTVKDFALYDLAKSKLSGTISFKLPDFVIDSIKNEYGSAVSALFKAMTYEINSNSTYTKIDGNIKVLLSDSTLLTASVTTDASKAVVTVPETAEDLASINYVDLFDGIDYEVLANNARECGLPEEIVSYIDEDTIENLLGLNNSYYDYDYDYGYDW